jgi:hypothetical protein
MVMKETDVVIYRQIHQSELTSEQLRILRNVSRERITERVCVLLGEGKLALSQVQAKYGKIMNIVGRA